ncbi:MAG: hypothetical protein ACMUIE_05525 [Thermoplasmatota archaeon]
MLTDPWSSLLEDSTMKTPSLLLVLLLVASALIVVIDTETTEASQGERDGGGYRYTDGNDPEPVLTANYIDVKGDPNSEGLDTNNFYALNHVDLGFTFEYYGRTFTKIYLSTYGAMSFIENDGNAFYYYYQYPGIPSSSSPRGLMAVYWNWESCRTSNRDRQYILRTEIDGEKVFIVEWNTDRGSRFQALLYEGGMIKYQYSSIANTPIGSYVFTGIVSPDGTTGIPYFNYQYTPTDKFSTPFAIAFTKNDVQVGEGRLMNGDKDEQVYAGSKPYIFSTDIYHSKDADSILNVIMTLGSLPGQENIRLMYSHSNRTFSQITGVGHAALLVSDCAFVKKNTNTLTVFFHVDFKITYPSEDKRNVTVLATGKSAVPSSVDYGGLYKVENDVEWSRTSLKVRTAEGDQRYLQENDHVAGGENIRFSGFRVFYERSDVQPPPTIFSMFIFDNFGTEKTTYIPQGGALSLPWTAVEETAVMTITFAVIGFPLENRISSNFTFTLQVDTQPPGSIVNDTVEILADSLNGEPATYDSKTDTYYDNDDSFFIRWKTITDGESGIGGYRVVAQTGDYRLEKFQTEVDKESGTASIQLGFDDPLPEGLLIVSLQAVDLVGNVGEKLTRKVVVDRTGPRFELVYPGENEWTMSTNPTIKVRIDDDLSPIDGPSLFYRVSTNGITYSSWESLLYYGKSKNSVEIELEPRLVEGRGNLIEIKGQDIAESDLVISQEIPVWVDSRAPSITLQEPAIDENGTTIEWIKDVYSPLRISIHDWKGAGVDPSAISYRYSKNNGDSFSADIPLEGEPFNNSQGYEEYTFQITKDWTEGDGNILILEAKDRVGRDILKEFRIRVDVTPEVEVVSPEAGEVHYDNQTIHFRADVTDLDGNEDIKVTWMSNIDGLFGFSIDIETELSQGEHLITLTVEDGVHTIKRVFPLQVNSALDLDPDFRDTDGDGMNDTFELTYGLDPEKNDADEDLDGDGYSNLEEYYAGTDPSVGTVYPGSTLKELDLDMVPIVLLVIGLVLFLGFAALAIRESNRPAPPPQINLPPYGYQQANLPPYQPISGGFPALPPAEERP